MNGKYFMNKIVKINFKMCVDVSLDEWVVVGGCVSVCVCVCAKKRQE